MWAEPLQPGALTAQDLLEAAPDAMVGVDSSGVIMFVNRQTEVLFGFERCEILGQGVELLVPEALRIAHAAHRQRYAERPITRPMGAGLELAGRRKDGTQFPVDISLTSIDTDNGPLFVAAVRDVTQRKLTEEALRLAEERFRSAFEDAPIGMALLRLDGTVAQVNEAFCRLLGCTGQDLLDAAGRIVVAGDPLVNPTLRERMLDGRTRLHREERRLAGPDGQLVYLLLTISLLPDAQGDPSQFLVHVEDISAAKQAKAQLKHRALHDPLTDLPNRTLLLDRLTQALARSQRRLSLIGVMFLDLDRFKVVNDTLGHDAGDQILVEVAVRIKDVLRRGDTAARLGGDEFVLLCEDLSDEAEGVEIARRVSQVLALPFTVHGRELTVGASIGLALTRAESLPETILSNADAAMYRAKQGGGGRVEILNDAVRPRPTSPRRTDSWHH
jgi:diguanylate cyclase (GGDEF)-like protein/PAS domain S-box-containing protein